VNYSSVPGDGNVDSYTYLPHRSLIYRFPRIPNAYFTILGGGEFRFTGEDIQNPAYQNLRANGYYGNFVEVNTGNILYLRSDNRIRATKIGTTDEYIPIQATDLIAPSSQELKENIRDIKECATDLLCGLDIVKYDYINGDKDRIGVIAEKSKVIDDGKSVSIVDTMFLNTKAVQEIDERLTKLEELLA